jgi:hypothetical protein
MAELPVQIPSRQRKKLIHSLETYSSLHTQYGVPYGVPLFMQQAYPNGRFMPTSNKSKIYDNAAGSKIGSVIGIPAKAIPFAPSMNNSFNPENGLMRTLNNSQIDQALHLAPRHSVFNTENSNINSSNNSANNIKKDFLNKKDNIGMTVTTPTSITLANSRHVTPTSITLANSRHVKTSVSMSNINLSRNKDFSHSLKRIYSNLFPL